ncbi:MAG: hypothetical protein WC262_12545 [Bacteroidales bacterium]|jgi:hypothetical protein
MEDEIANLIGYWDWENKTANQCAAAVLSLIDSQRCVWTFTDDYTIKTECGEELKPYCKDDLYKRKKPSHCWNCGKRIEVKDGQG